jgi:hypothetical protein
MVSENEELREVFWLKRNKIIQVGHWRKFCHDRFQKNEMDKVCARMGTGEVHTRFWR